MITKGYEYLLEGSDVLETFAKGILQLVNIKSSRKDTILEVKTIEGTNKVTVVSMVELENFIDLEGGIWLVKYKDTISIATDIEFNSEAHKEIDKMIDNEEGVFLHVEQF